MHGNSNIKYSFTKFNTSAANSVPPEVTSLKWSQIKKHSTDNFHIRTMHLDIIKVFYSPTNAQVIVLKTILKFTLKQLRHVSVQSHHHQGAHYQCMLKLHFVKIVNPGTSV